jgi:pimeloyl-ACP methyl ester carboxylesterase
MLKSGDISQMFDLKNACIPVALFSGKLDEVSTQENVDYLRQILPNIVFDETIDGYGHLDLLFANDFNERIGHKIVKLFKECPQ